MRYISNIINAFLATVLLVCLWLVAPSLLIVIFDFNIAAIKVITNIVPYGAKIEVAMRSLGADRALVFLEATLAVKILSGFLQTLRKGVT